MDAITLVSLIVPIGGAFAALIASDTVRKILAIIFRRPTSRSVVLKSGDETLVIDNVSAGEELSLINEFIRRHTEEESNLKSAEETPGSGGKGDRHES
jgi:hypothetical protein